ncbi:MAG TPA: hypothetical protein VEI02_03545, partial [Planctomycetota bacterium]|nr:hypothetical protein [Planctomycetota bacterium]
LFASPGPSPTPIPVGAWGAVFLEPTTAVAVLAGAFDASGAAAPAFVVPAAPGLVGLSLWWQAALPAELRLTGAEETPVLGP